MDINPLSIGDTPTLDQVLDTRERRVEFQERIAKKFQGKILTAYKLNIPGPVKNNDLIRSVFSKGVETIKKELKVHDIELMDEKSVDEITGPEAFFITEGDFKEIKMMMVMIEEKSPLGRLYDLDVMTAKDDGMHYISRKDLNLPQRECLICGKPAKVCGRSRAHSVETMQEKIHELILQDKKGSSL